LLLRFDQSQPGFVNESSRLQRMSRRFLGHFVCRQPAEFLINEWKQFIGGFRFAFFKGFKEVGDFTHSSRVAKHRQTTNRNI
jgi:hypothetical protein